MSQSAIPPPPPDDEFDCGCKVICRVEEKDKGKQEPTCTLEACGDPDCPIRKMFIEESNLAGKPPVFGYKEIQ